MQLNSVSSVLGLTATLVPDGQGSADQSYVSFWQQQQSTLHQGTLEFCCDSVSF